MSILEEVKDEALKVNDKLDAVADQGISDAANATGKFTFWALVGAGVVTLAVIGLLLAF